MNEIVTLPNGTTELILSERDIEAVLMPYVGYDFAQLVMHKVVAGAEKKSNAAKALEQECSGYANTVYSYESAVADALGALKPLMEYVRVAKRIDRDKLAASLRGIVRELKNIEA